MRILIAPDKFKGSLSAAEAANAIEKGINTVDNKVNIVKSPLADGGEGTSKVLGEHFKGKKIQVQVHDPLMRKIQAHYYFSRHRREAYIEMAAASGLELLNKEERNPLYTTSYGTGEMINDAVIKGAEHILLCMGGSATNDAGVGMANALGYRFIDAEEEDIKPVGMMLKEIKNYFPSKRNTVDRTRFTVLTDVSNTLYGANGAAYVYGPQKGAGKETCEKLDEGLRNLSQLIHFKTGIDMNEVKGAGAAGGMGAGAISFLNAKLVNGADYIIDLLGIPEHIERSDWIITGEGKLDQQTLTGKLIARIGQVAQNKHKKIVVVCGQNTLTPEELNEIGITQVIDLLSIQVDLKKSMKQSEKLIFQVVKRWALDNLK